MVTGQEAGEQVDGMQEIGGVVAALRVTLHFPAVRSVDLVLHRGLLYRGRFEMSGVKRLFTPESKAEAEHRKMPPA